MVPEALTATLTENLTKQYIRTQQMERINYRNAIERLNFRKAQLRLGLLLIMPCRILFLLQM